MKLHLLTVRKNKKIIGMEELEEAITRVIAGPEKKARVISEHDRKLTAYHEAGHAVVMKYLPILIQFMKLVLFQEVWQVDILCTYL